ncbi:MAG: hypothetical protein ACYTFQ_02795 [Planctomycetota bacterium]
MKRIILFGLVLCVLVCGGGGMCGPGGNTGTIKRYATSMRGCGDGRTYSDIWYVDDYGDPLTDGGMRMGQISGSYAQYTKDDYAPGRPFWEWCSNVKLSGGGPTGDGGRARIKGVWPKSGSCNGNHPVNTEHCATARYGVDWLNMVVFFSCYANPPAAGVWMMPNDNCYEPPAGWEPPTRETVKGPVSVNGQKALGAPTSGGASAMAMMGPAVIDPNAIELPWHGIDYSHTLVRQYDTYSRAVPQVNPSDVNDWEMNYRYQYPCKYETIIAQAVPQESVGAVYTATVRSSLGEIKVDALVVAQNDAKTVTLVATDLFLPVDPDTYVSLMIDPNEPVIFDRWNKELSAEELPWYDPNQWSDPNDCPGLTLDTRRDDFMDKHDPNRAVPMQYLPCDDVDEITIEYHVTVDMLSEFWDNWLKYAPNADLNDDGIVNMEDFGNLFQEF